MYCVKLYNSALCIAIDFTQHNCVCCNHVRAYKIRYKFHFCIVLKMNQLVCV